MPHLDEGTIHAWLDGELQAADLQAAERHAADCAECSERLAEARGVMAGASRIVAALDAGPADVIPRAGGAAPARRPTWRRWFTPAWTAAAATLVVAAGLTITARKLVNAPASSSSVVDRAAPASAPAARPATNAPAVSAPTAPAPAALLAAKPDAKDSNDVEVAKHQPTRKPVERQKVLDAAALAPTPRAAVAGGIAVAAKTSAAASDTAGLRAGARAIVADSMQRAPAPRPLAQLSAQAATPGAVGGRVQRVEATMSTGGGVVSNALNEFQFQGCYRVDAAPAWRGTLPDSFALDTRAPAVAPAGEAGSRRGPANGALSRDSARAFAPRAVGGFPVRGVTAAGAVDSTTLGDWVPASPRVANVRFYTAGGRVAVSIELSGDKPTARVAAGGRSDSVRVFRIDCRR